MAKLFSIGEVSQKLDIPISTIRYYDKQGLLPLVKRTESGIRQFDDLDMEILSCIDCFKAANMSLKDIKHYFNLYEQGDSTLQERYDLITKHNQVIENELERLKQAQTVLKTKSLEYWKQINPE